MTITAKTSRVRIANRLATDCALSLRLAGKTFREIASEMNISRARAFQIVDAGLTEIETKCNEKIETMRRLESERLDALHAAQWPRKAEPECAKVILRIMERRARLLALDIKIDNENERRIQLPQENSSDIDLDLLTVSELQQLEEICSVAAQRAQEMTVKTK